MVYGGGDIVFDTKRSKWIQWEQYAEDTVRSGRSTQWTQYAVHAVEKWYMVVRTLSLIQKGQTSGCSMQWMQWNSGIWWWGHCLSCKKVKPEDAVDKVCSVLVVYGGGDIVFDAKRSNQWIQWMQSHSGHSTQWMQWTQYAVDTVCSGHSRIVVYGGGDIVFRAKRSNQRIQWMQCAVG